MPHTLLLADDSVTIRRVIELTFADESVRVVSVNNGRDALTRIEAERPSIVLADVGLPDVSGYDISTFVKSRPDLRHIAVVLLAGAFDPLDEARSRKCGSDGVLVKPFEPQLVVARVKELLSGPAKPFTMPAPASDATVRTPSAPPLLQSPGVPTSPEGRENEMVFDASLDRLDQAFSNTGTGMPALDAEAATDFANDLRELRSTRTDSGGFERHDFGDWDLPPRPAEPATEAMMPESFESFQADVQASRTVEYDARPANMPNTTNAAPMPPPVTLVPKAAQAPPPVARREPAPSRTGSPLADAFTSLLAAEEGRPHSPVRQAVQASVPDNAALTDEAMDLIVDRVIARLGSGVRGAVIDLAERLVRAEIDRLKAIR